MITTKVKQTEFYNDIEIPLFDFQIDHDYMTNNPLNCDCGLGWSHKTREYNPPIEVSDLNPYNKDSKCPKCDFDRATSKAVPGTTFNFTKDIIIRNCPNCKHGWYEVAINSEDHTEYYKKQALQSERNLKCKANQRLYSIEYAKYLEANGCKNRHELDRLPKPKSHNSISAVDKMEKEDTIGITILVAIIVFIIMILIYV